MNKKYVAIILMVCALVLGACFSPWKGDEGTFNIVIGKTNGGTNGRAGTEAPDTGEQEEVEVPEGLLYTITLSKGPGPNQEKSDIAPDTTVHFSVVPGRWLITITAFLLDGEKCAEGSEVVTIKPGQNGVIEIGMTRVIPEEPDNQTPVASDFTVNGLSQIYDGKPKTVHITPNNHEKSGGAITIYYDGETTAPSAIGSYEVTFNVAAAPGWNAVTGLTAGTLVIGEQTANPETPVAGDFDIGNLTQTVGSVTDVTIKPKTGKSNGVITIYYDGSADLPTTVGSYPVTFDIDEAIGWNAVSGLPAGTLTITPQQGSATINISLWVNEQDGTIELTPSGDTNNIIISGDQTFSVTVNWPGNPNEIIYEWYVGGSPVKGNPDGSITISAKNYNPGTYQLMVMVTISGKPYSTEISFKVQ